MLPMGGPEPKVFREDLEWVAQLGTGIEGIPQSQSHGHKAWVAASAYLKPQSLHSLFLKAVAMWAAFLSGMAAVEPLGSVLLFCLSEGLAVWGTATVVVESITVPSQIWQFRVNAAKCLVS